MTRPDYLVPGDKIAIAAPARKISMEELTPAIRLFESWGLDVMLPEGLFAESNQFAGSDIVRTDLLQSLLDDNTVKAIICARGGYGTARIIDNLDFTKFAAHPKWIVGYSDITVLHSHIHQNYGIETLHATMPINIPTDADMVEFASIKTLKAALFGEGLNYCGTCGTIGRKGTAEGLVVGGNLSILYSLCGSPSTINTDGKILFIEDLDEYLYHIDRMMMNLKRNGMLANLAGLVVGQMSDMHDNAIPFGRNVWEIVMDAVKEYDYPVCLNFPAGHNGTGNNALFLGRNAKLSVGISTTLTFDE